MGRMRKLSTIIEMPSLESFLKDWGEAVIGTRMFMMVVKLESENIWQSYRPRTRKESR